MPAAEFPQDVTALLGRLRDRLAVREDIVGVYVYGSLVTGDYSPAASDIDVIVLVAREPGRAMIRELTELHKALAGTAGPAGQLHCLYVAADAAADPERLCTYWFGDRMTQWQMKLLTQAELASAGVALYGPWPPPGIRPVPVAAIQAAVYEEVTGYWRRLSRKRVCWLRDSEVDHGLVVLPRAEALLTTGELITKSQAISRLAGFGLPDWLTQEIRRRRDGDPVSVGKLRRVRRALLTRRVMRDGVARLSRLDPADC
ncbi:MAG: nucleotidyltransferase domain-containing protein [Streptosporangiaceae bacterium]|nr:nucleotidyltransferase domain-containing protein [Streptosporangiaceae bacterium]